MKNHKYYRQKYMDHPVYKYNFYTIKKYNNILGFFVGRVCEHKGSLCLRFVEYYGSINILKNIKHSLLNFIKNSKYEYIDFYNFGIDKNILTKAGFKENKFNDKFIIPNYYEPFENKNIRICSIFWPKNTKLLIFKGDGDQDRPNQIKKTYPGILY